MAIAPQVPAYPKGDRHWTREQTNALPRSVEEMSHDWCLPDTVDRRVPSVAIEQMGGAWETHLNMGQSSGMSHR